MHTKCPLSDRAGDLYGATSVLATSFQHLISCLLAHQCLQENAAAIYHPLAVADLQTWPDLPGTSVQVSCSAVLYACNCTLLHASNKRALLANSAAHH